MKSKLLMTVMIALSSVLAIQAAPTTGDYVNDPQSEYVQDRSLDRIATVNMIMCFVSKFRADAFVNQGEYLALIDQGKCESDKSSGETTSAGADSAVTFAKVFASTTRASNSAAQIVRGRLFLSEEQGEITVFIYAELNEAPSATAPNGRFTMQFEGYSSADLNTKIFQGVLQANGSVLTFTETSLEGAQTVTTRLSLSQDGTADTGSGRVVVSGGTENVDEAFAYNATHFFRGDSGNSMCFDRSRNNVDVSTWRYGVYNMDGSRLTLSNPGFPLNYTPTSGAFAGKQVWGFAGYYGIYFPDAVFEALKADSGAVLSRPDNNATYSLSTSPGKLTRLSKSQTTLSGVKGQPLRMFLNTGTSFLDTEIAWDGTAFQKVREVRDASNGQTSTAVSGTLTAQQLRDSGQFSLHGYSQSLGGEVQIQVPSTGEFLASTPVVFRSRTQLTPAQTASLNLRCVSQCPATGSALNDAATVYQDVDGSAFNFRPVPNASVVQYSFSNGVMQQGASSVDASASNNLNNSQFRWGVYSGSLFDVSDLADVQCDSSGNPSPGGSHVCGFLVGDLNTVYQYETGPNPWNQYVGLTPVGSSTPVVFDAPKTFTFAITENNTTLSGTDTLVGSSIVLDYQGFGQLHGIPGSCVNPANNEKGACDSTTFTRYVPQFSIQDGAIVNDGQNDYFVKYLDREVRLRNVAASTCTGLGLSLPLSTALPSPATVNIKTLVGAVGDSVNQPSTPSVIHGVIQTASNP